MVATEKIRIRAPKTVAAMREAARLFLNTLDTKRRERAMYSFDSCERQNWHYVPKTRNGLPRCDMNDVQLAASESLIRASVSEAGATKAMAIMANEAILESIEAANGTLWHDRDPTLYFFTVFGEPDDGDPWAWRVEGHHLTLNYTVFGDEVDAVTPSFLGCNRAEV